MRRRAASTSSFTADCSLSKSKNSLDFVKAGLLSADFD
jgi:hypothetical protein